MDIARLIVYLKCFTNNHANMVFQCFINGTQVFGLPFHVRGDRGVENVDVAQFMIQNRTQQRELNYSDSCSDNL